MLIVHVEDDDLKARAVRKMLLALTCGVDVARAQTLDEALELLEEQPAAVVTDWCFPVGRGTGACEGLGAAVVEACQKAGIAVLVVSGSDRPATFRGDWAGNDWLGALRRLLARVGVLDAELAS